VVGSRRNGARTPLEASRIMFTRHILQLPFFLSLFDRTFAFVILVNVFVKCANKSGRRNLALGRQAVGCLGGTSPLLISRHPASSDKIGSRQVQNQANTRRRRLAASPLLKAAKKHGFGSWVEGPCVVCGGACYVGLFPARA